MAASDDAIVWPALLRGKRFAEQRAKIESPYRHDSQQGGSPTAADYQRMNNAIGEVRGILRQNLKDTSMDNYRDAQESLDRLAAEVQQGINDDSTGK